MFAKCLILPLMAYLPITVACADIIFQVTVCTEHGLRHQLGNAFFLCVFINILVFVVAFWPVIRVDIYLNPQKIFSNSMNSFFLAKKNIIADFFLKNYIFEQKK